MITLLVRCQNDTLPNLYIKKGNILRAGRASCVAFPVHCRGLCSRKKKNSLVPAAMGVTKCHKPDIALLPP